VNQSRFAVRNWAGVHFLPFLANKNEAHHPQPKKAAGTGMPTRGLTAHSFTLGAQLHSRTHSLGLRRSDQECDSDQELGRCAFSAIAGQQLECEFCKLRQDCQFAILTLNLVPLAFVPQRLESKFPMQSSLDCACHDGSVLDGSVLHASHGVLHAGVLHTRLSLDTKVSQSASAVT
jgi:hypothetical protein